MINNELSLEVFKSTYSNQNESVEDMFRRVAQKLAEVEDDSVRNYWESQFKDLLNDFKFVPGGRILSNAGLDLKGTTFINCFVDGFTGEDQDSMNSIMDALKRQSLILKSEGGYGFCADVMRPKGGFIHGIANESPGAVKMLDMWDTQSAVITAGSGKKSSNKHAKGKIRKGAQMVTMSIWHPDIEEFITAKQEPGRLTKFNMSVLITDAFMDAVKTHSAWHLMFPDYEAAKEAYKKEWDGDIVKWHNNGNPVKIYKTYEDANELWNIIMESTYTRNEPGVLFVDTMNRMNNLSYCEHITATNPCVSGDTLVLTPRGWKRADSIEEGDILSTVLGEEPVKTKEVNVGVQLYKVRFSDGGELRATGSHQFHVRNPKTKKIELKQLRDLAPGDKIRLSGNAYYTPTYNEDYKSGLKYGVLLGDGNYSRSAWQHDYIKIASNIEDKEYNANLKSLFGEGNFRNPDISKDSKSVNFVLKSSESRKYFDQFKLTPSYSHEKEISDFTDRSINEYMGILDGLLATDGNVNLKSNHPQLRWFTTSHKLAQQIRQMLLAIGSYGIITESNDKGGTIDGREINRIHTKYSVSVSGESFRNYAKFSLVSGLHPEKGKKIQEGQIDFILSGNNWSTTITSIEKDEIETVYDFFCEQSDTWITNGYVSRGCGEQILPIGGVCLLGSFNLTQFVNSARDGWDFEKLERYIPIAVRMLDNVNDTTYVPLESQEKNLKAKRRVGMGIMGLGSALMMMRVRYGANKKSLKLINSLMSFIANKAYQSSALLASEKGSFPMFNKREYLVSPFIQGLDEETVEMIDKYGLRNSHLLSIQPTGNTSTLANVVSSGLEPIFLPRYIRTAIVPHKPDNMVMPEKVDFNAGTAAELNGWSWIKEGDENLLTINFEGDRYKIDSNRGLTKEHLVEDYAVSELSKLGEYDPNAEWHATTMDLNIDDHIKVMEVISKYIDSAMSKTVNLPADYPFEDFKQLYAKLHATGTIKGGTTYRDGTMTSVLSSVKDDNSAGIHKTTAPKRPESLPCDIYHTTVKGVQWIVIVGLLNDDPYEVFAFKQTNLVLPKSIKSGELKKVKRNHYDLVDSESGLTMSDIGRHFDRDEEEALTRMISTALRHGARIKFIVEQLNKSEGTVSSFSKAIARTLKKYIPDGDTMKATCESCGSENIAMEDGCFKCLDCGSSKCS